MTRSSERASSEVDISIVMPCLDEEQSVADCVAKAQRWLQGSGLRGEIIVVDNGSTDASAALAVRAGAKVVQAAERGYGRACITGMVEAQGKWIIMGDCDGTYDFERLDPLIDLLADGCDIAIGNRFSDMMAAGAMPWAHRVLGTPLINLLLRTFAGARISDSQCGLRGITRDAFRRLKLRARGMEFASEMLLRASRLGLKIGEAPVPYYQRIGEAKLNTFRDGWRHLRFLLLHSPDYVFLVPGSLFCLLGVLSLGTTAFEREGITVGSLDWQPVFAGPIFLVVGVNTVLLGLGAKLFAVNRETQGEDALVRFYRQYLGVEALLFIGIVLALVGIGVDAYIFVRWLRGSTAEGLIHITAVAQALIVIGANLLFGSIMLGIIDDRS